MATTWFDGIKKVLGLEQAPTRLLEARKTFRVPCNVPLKVNLKDDKLVGRMVNLSSKGIRVEVDKPMPAGQQADVVLTGRTRADDVRLTIQVVWCKRHPKRSYFDIGCTVVGYYQNNPGAVVKWAAPDHPAAQVDNRQKRQSQRLPCTAPASSVAVTVTLADDTTCVGTAHDLSRRGILMSLRQPLTVGNDIGLRIELDQKTVISARGTVKRCVEVAGGGSWETACFMSGMPIDDRERLEKALGYLRPGR